MRRTFWMSVVVAAGLLISGSQMQAVAQGRGGGGGGGGQGGGRGGFGGGGFGGGQMGQRVQGTVTAATGYKVTIQTQAGDSYDITAADNARITRSGQPIKLSDIKPGDNVTAMGQVDATKKTVQATMISDVDAVTLAKAVANMGKTYILGRITAIDADNLKLTVARTDNVSQVIAVDDGTSFQRGTSGVQADAVAAGALSTGGGFGGGRGMGGGRGGAQAATPPAPESITLADIKVGDTVMATGALKNGAFTVLKMGVSTPGAGPGASGGGRRGAQGQPVAADPIPQPAVVPQ
jgi:hypothetical protein